MGRGRTGQTQVLTAVLLGGILVSGIAAAYVWGLPILRKNQDINNAEASLQSMRQLASGVTSVAQQGGSRSVTMNLGDGSLQIDPANDTVTYTAVTRGAYVSTQRWVPLNENDMQGVNDDGALNLSEYGVRGADRPVLLVGTAAQGNDAFVTRYRIVSRLMEDPTSAQTYRIDLVGSGSLDVSGGSQEVVLQRGETETVPGAGVDGGVLNRVQVRIRVS